MLNNVPHQYQFTGLRHFAALSIFVATAILLSSCARVSETASDVVKMTTKPTEKVQVAKKVDEKAYEEEDKEEEKEKEEEKAEDREYAAMKKQLREDQARAAKSGESGNVSKLFFDTEILLINERVHKLSERMEHLSDRIHKLAERLEFIPSKIAELEAALKQANENRSMVAAKPEPKPMAGANAPKQLTKYQGAPFWGVQLGAYKTKAGAEVAWAEFLNNLSTVELNDASVRYIPSAPLKSGKRLMLIIINEYPNRTAAMDACEGLKGGGIDCVAMHIR